MERVSLLLPTRARPSLATRFLKSARDRAAHPDFVEAVLYVDSDDVSSQNIDCPGLDVHTIIGPRSSMGTYNTRCLSVSRGEIVILTNDDVVIGTDGWDEAVRALHRSICDKVYLAYPNDLFKGEAVCTFPILSREACRLLGDPFPLEYKGAFIDYHLLDIFKRIERMGTCRLVYLPHVVFEHMHYRTGKGVFDETYRSRNRFEDDATFLALAGKRSEAAYALLGALSNSASKGNVTAKAAAPSDGGLLGATLLDRELPWRWRARLFVWFVGRRLLGPYLSRRARRKASE
jgi:hypothetical protein